MSANWRQVFLANPTTTFQSNDIFYLARSPYGPTDDFGFTYSSLIPLTTKGDLFTWSTAATRLGVGSNGTILMADSTQTTGLKWSSSASGGGLAWVSVSGTTQTIAANTAYVATNVALTSFSLPASAVLGDTFIIKGEATCGGWSVLTASGKTIYVGNGFVTGNTDSVDSTDPTDSAVFRCIQASPQIWSADSLQGVLFLNTMVSGNQNSVNTTLKDQTGTGKFVGDTSPTFTNSIAVVGNVNGFQYVGAENHTDATIKNLRIGAYHYTNSEEPFSLVFGASTSTLNILYLGGGTGFGNACTTTSIFAAANNTTVTGTEIVRVTTSGLSIINGGFSIGTLTEGSVLFSGASGAISQDNSNFFWNDSTNRLGIGTNIPGYTVDIVGDMQTQLVNINSTNPILTYYENSASLDNKRWQTSVASEQWTFSITNDINTVGTLVMSVDRTGTTVDNIGVNTPSITLTQDTNIVTSGGVNGFSVDGTTFSVDGTNNRIGIGTAAPGEALSVSGAIDIIGSSPQILKMGSISTLSRDAGTGALTIATNASHIILSPASGFVGIGTTSPISALQVVGERAGSPGSKGVHIGMNSGNDAGIELTANASSDSSYIDFNYTSTDFRGRIIYANSTDSMSLETAGASRLFINSTGAIRFTNYGAGVLNTDASGNITAVSDERLKTDVKEFSKGLNEVLNLKPVTYKWSKESGYDTLCDYTGFIAQEVKEVIPEAIGQMNDDTKYLTFSDRAITAALVNAVKELNLKIEAIKNI